jgi:hypothetical protein
MYALISLMRMLRPGKTSGRGIFSGVHAAASVEMSGTLPTPHSEGSDSTSSSSTTGLFGPVHEDDREPSEDMLLKSTIFVCLDVFCGGLS